MRRFTRLIPGGLQKGGFTFRPGGFFLLLFSSTCQTYHFLIASQKALWSKPTSKSKIATQAHVCPDQHSRIKRMLAECPVQLFHSLSALPSPSPETSFEKARVGPRRYIAVPFAGCRGFRGLLRWQVSLGKRKRVFCILNLVVKETAPPICSPQTNPGKQVN